MPAPIERGVMGAPQAHGISPLVAAAEKKQFKESSHYIPSDCLCEAFCPGREREQAGVFVSNQLEATREQTRDKTSVNSKSEPFRRLRQRGGFECRSSGPVLWNPGGNGNGVGHSEETV